MKDYNHYLKEVGEIGYIRSVFHSMVYASGLPKARVMELVVTETGQRGIIQSLLPDSVEILMLDGSPVRHGTAITRTNELLTVPVGDSLLGRSVDPFVNPIDGKGILAGLQENRPYESPAPSIGKRAKIAEPFFTGVAIIDFMVPLGRGQRELVLGDQKSGKTAFTLQAIVSAAKQGSVCIYVAIGKKKAEIKRLEEYLTNQGVRDQTIIVAADASSPASFIYLVPFTGMTIAEYFRDIGKEVLLVLDDLNVHAKLYREISLLSKKTPGREAYPGDIFYIHSHLLERAGNVYVTSKQPLSIKRNVDDQPSENQQPTEKLKIPGLNANNNTTQADVVANLASDVAIPRSITVLAIVETVGGDFTGYIQTNAMSMTDGHIYFDSENFHRGQRPPVNIELSVSRVGHQTRRPYEISFSDTIRNILHDYRQALNYARFGVELSPKTRLAMVMGDKVMQLFNQDADVIVEPFLQQLYVALLLEGVWFTATRQKMQADKASLAKAYTEGKLSSLAEELLKTTNLVDFRTLLKQRYATVIGSLINEQLLELTEANVATAQALPQQAAQAGEQAPAVTATDQVDRKKLYKNGQPGKPAPKKRSLLGKLTHLGK